MATYTSHYHLKKPEPTDTTEIIADLNSNYDLIDTNLYGKASTAHATTHITGGSDVISDAVAGGNSGLMSGADKQNLADVVTKKHTQNTDQYLDQNGANQVSAADVKDAVTKKHEHTNKALLDTYTQTENNLADAVVKKHSQGTDTTLGNMSADINMNSHKITNVTDPTSAQDAATKNYVDTHATQGIALDQVVLGSQIFG